MPIFFSIVIEVDSLPVDPFLFKLVYDILAENIAFKLSDEQEVKIGNSERTDAHRCMVFRVIL